MSVKDYIFRYAVYLPVRRSEKQKIKYLTALAQEFQSMGYHVDVRKSSMSYPLRRTKNYYNLYVGDIENAKKAFVTHYDTPTIQPFKQKAKITNLAPTKGTLVLNMILGVVLVIVFSSIGYYGLYPSFRLNGLLSWSGLLFLLYLIASFYIIKKFSEGIPRSKNYINNSSSVIALLAFAKTTNRKNIAFGILDDGCVSNYGMHMLQDVAKKAKQVYYFNSIGRQGTLSETTSETELSQDLFALHTKYPNIRYVSPLNTTRQPETLEVDILNTNIDYMIAKYQ